jgi:hypothetical protein
MVAIDPSLLKIGLLRVQNLTKLIMVIARDLAYWTNVMGLFVKGANPKKLHSENSCLWKLN